MQRHFARRLEAAVRSIAGLQGYRAGIGLILGSGLGAFCEQIEGPQVPYAKIEGFPVPTVTGHQGLLKLGRSVAVLSGRFHFYEGCSMDDVVLPVFLLHRLGVRTLLITNAAGGINRGYAVGDLVLIRDHLNLMGANPLAGPNPEELGPRFPDLSEAYSRRLRELARRLEDLSEGVYAALPGPSYETPAEIRMLAVLGADLVGMSTVPEVIAARYLGLEVLGISCVTNMAAGILPQPLDHREVIEAGKTVQPRFSRLLQGLLGLLAPQSR